MKAVAIVILFPLLSVITVSLYVHGGTSRIAALALLAVCVVGVLTNLVWKRARAGNDTEAFDKTSR
jgi:hypothetical protein